MSAVITVRLSKELRDRVRELGINVSEFVRQALREEVERRERMALLNSLAEAREVLSKVDDEQIVETIRSSRESR